MNRENTFTLVGLGEILWDILPEGKQLGGAPANFAYHAQSLGAKGVVASCVGDDDLGREILGCLDKLSLDRQYISIDRDHPTGTVTVELDENGNPNFTIHENVAWDFIPLNEDLLDIAAETDAVCFGSLCQRSDVSRKTVQKFLQATKPDCIRVFDINIRQSYYSRKIIDTMLKLSNVLKLNNEELPLVSKILEIKGSESEILAQVSRGYELRLIVLTKGPKGSRLYIQGKDSIHKGIPPAKIVDTVGAGDAFTAAVTLGFLKGNDLDQINKHANRVASFVCSQSGATPKLPHDLI